MKVWNGKGKRIEFMMKSIGHEAKKKESVGDKRTKFTVNSTGNEASDSSRK